MRVSSFRFALELNLPPGCPHGTFIRVERALLIGHNSLRRTVLSNPEMVNGCQHVLRFSTLNQSTLRPANAHTTNVCYDHVILQEKQIELDTFIESAGNSQRGNRSVRAPLPFSTNTASIHNVLYLCKHVFWDTSCLHQISHSLRRRVP